MPSAPPVVTLRAVAKSVREGGALRPVLRGVDLDVAAGEAVAVLGRSGSGKSTLLNLIAGIDDADAGAITTCGVDVVRADERARPAARAAELLAQVGLADRADAWPDVLSGGEQQRVAVARALAPQPALLLCDEPTGNLDDAAAAAVLDLLHGLRRAHGAALVVVTHSAAAAAACDRRLRLDGGVLRAAGDGA